MKFKFLIFLVVTLFISLDAKKLDKLNLVHQYILTQYSNNLNEEKTKLDIHLLNKTDDYAFIQTILVDKKGQYIDTEYIEDIVFTLCLKEVNNRWQVIYDLSRTDVPTENQIIEIENSFPKEFPKSLLSEFWQNILMDDNKMYNAKLQNFNYGLISLEDFYKIHRSIYKQKIDNELEKNNKEKAINLQLESLKNLENMMGGIIQRYKVGIADKDFLNKFQSYLQLEQYYYESLTNKPVKNDILKKYNNLIKNLD